MDKWRSRKERGASPGSWEVAAAVQLRAAHAVAVLQAVAELAERVDVAERRRAVRRPRGGRGRPCCRRCR